MAKLLLLALCVVAVSVSGLTSRRAGCAPDQNCKPPEGIAVSIKKLPVPGAEYVPLFFYATLLPRLRAATKLSFRGI